MKTIRKSTSAALAGFLFILFSLPIQLFAQKFGYVDTEYILGQMPEYRSAQKVIDEVSEKWQKEMDAKHLEIENLYKDYNAQKVILPVEEQRKREDQIIQKEKDLKKFQQDKFGFEGELFKKRQELIKPIQDKVYDAIQKVAKENNLDFIFDKSGDMIMLFSNAKFDKSDEVLKGLGVVPSKKDEKESDLPPGGGDLPPDSNPPR